MKKQAHQNSDNKGTLIVDATIADQDIRYPTDLSLLNEMREISEKIIHVLYKQSVEPKNPEPTGRKPEKPFIGLSSLVKTMHFECKALALSFHNGCIATHCSLTGTTFSRS